jgi:hypothetical protein
MPKGRRRKSSGTEVFNKSEELKDTIVLAYAIHTDSKLVGTLKKKPISS